MGGDGHANQPKIEIQWPKYLIKTRGIHHTDFSFVATLKLRGVCAEQSQNSTKIRMNLDSATIPKTLKQATYDFNRSLGILSPEGW
jgi:hypothetical protein